MIVLRRLGSVLLFAAALLLAAGCEFLVAPTPFGAPADSAADEDDSSPATPTGDESAVHLAAISGITVPVVGETPVQAVSETDQYTGSVVWEPDHDPFQGETRYSATITLSPKSGFTFVTVGQDFFTVEGADIVTNSAGSGEITAIFPETPTVYSVGDVGPAGGLIFYVNPNYETDGWQYLEAAPESTEWINISWGKQGTLVGATNTGIGAGKTNTDLIVSKMNEVPVETGTAAQVTDGLIHNGFDDWFLPSEDELNQMYLALSSQGLDVWSGSYWSSTEVDVNFARVQSLLDPAGPQSDLNRSFNQLVRAVRAF